MLCSMGSQLKDDLKYCGRRPAKNAAIAGPVLLHSDPTFFLSSRLDFVSTDSFPITSCFLHASLLWHKQISLDSYRLRRYVSNLLAHL